MKLAHIVNIYACPEGSDAWRIQNVTLETLRRARIAAGSQGGIVHLSAQFAEDLGAVPDFFTPTRNLDRSIQDFVECPDKRKLPFIHDILTRAWEATDADYLIYSNMDIAVYPSFYCFIRKAIGSGIDALAINRAQIRRHTCGIDRLHACTVDELLKVRMRLPHHGIDCVLFRRETFPRWRPADICIGYPPVGQYLLENAECHSTKFAWFKDAFQTFHIGIDSDDSSPWKKLQGNAIWNLNSQQFDEHRLYLAPAWERHGFTRFKWIMRRVRWLLRSLLPVEHSIKIPGKAR